MRINYFYNDKGNVYFSPFKIKYNTTALTFVNQLTVKHLFTLDGYFKSVRSIFNIKQKIPIIINNKTILIYSKGFSHYKSIFINFYEIESVIKFDKNILIHFKDSSELKLDMSYYEYVKYRNKVIKMLKYKNNLE